LKIKAFLDVMSC